MGNAGEKQQNVIADGVKGIQLLMIAIQIKRRWTREKKTQKIARS
jgi:hypothetical protein